MTSAEAYRILKEARALMDPDCEANHTLTVSMGSMECAFVISGRVVGPVSFDSYDLAQAIGVVLGEANELSAKPEPCAHGDVCRAYMRERGVILRDTCPDCEHYEPRGD